MKQRQPYSDSRGSRSVTWSTMTICSNDETRSIRPPHRHGSAKLLAVLALALVAGISVWITQAGARDRGPSTGKLERIWGKRGVADGHLQKPRAAAIDEHDRIYIVDMLARIQVFDTDGNLLRKPQRTPEFRVGKPTGLSIDPEGNLMVADTHYYRVLRYSPEGELLTDRTIGGTKGQGEGEFGLVTDAVVDSKGNTYVSEYGDFDRIQKFSPEGKFLLQWGGHGEERGQFRRPQNMAIDDQDRIWVVDACNHRVQVFDTEGNCLEMWGSYGNELGQLSYPYDIILTADTVYICEFGNHRIQKFELNVAKRPSEKTPGAWDENGQGRESLGSWGEAGHGDGKLHNPWAMVRDSRGRIHVIDTNHHRVQRIHF